MDQQTNVRVISLKDLWDIFIQRLWIMVLAAVLAVGGLFFFISLTFVPVYESTATLYILRQDEKEVTTGMSDDFSLALKVVNDCDYLLKSHSVLDEVIDKLNLDITYSSLSQCVTTKNPENTRILEVTVTSDTPEQAKRIVDNICLVGTEKITEAMGFEQVNLYEHGILNPEPCNKLSLMTYALIGLIVAILTYSAFLIAFLLDDRIRTDEDIERYLNLSILGEIPNFNDTKKNHYGYSTVYGKKQGKSSGKKEGN